MAGVIAGVYLFLRRGAAETEPAADAPRVDRFVQSTGQIPREPVHSR